MVAPVTRNDTATVSEDSEALIRVLANDTDADGNSLRVRQVFNTDGVASETGSNGLRNVGDGITFVPREYTDANGRLGFDYLSAGETATITVRYNAQDSSGENSAGDSSVTITITGQNDAVTAVDDAYTIAEDASRLFTAAELIGNDIDLDGNRNTTNRISAVGNAVGGTVVLNPNGTVTFTANPNFSGAASFEYTLTDGPTSDVGSVAITVTSVNDAPVAVDDVLPGAPNNAQTTIQTSTLLANDTDADVNSTLTVTAVSNSTGGTAVLNANGTITFTPTAGFFGTAGFDYTLSDGTATDTGRATFPVNAAPVPVADAVTITENGAALIRVLANDTDADGNLPLSVRNVFAGNGANASNSATPVNGATDNGDSISFFADLYNTNPANPAAGVQGFNYLKAGETTTVNIFYDIEDSTGVDSSFGTNVAVTVTGENDLPVANNDRVSVNAGEARTIAASEILGNDTDADGLAGNKDVLRITSVTNAVGGTAQLVDGNVVFTPSGGAGSSGSFSYTVGDGVGGSAVGQVQVGVGLARTFGTAGNDVINGTDAAEFFQVNQGGNDLVNALGGDDAIFFGDQFSNADTVVGGAGRDQLGLQGNYTGLLALNLANVTGVEDLILFTGADTRFSAGAAAGSADYNITTVDSTVAAGAVLTVDANGLVAGEDLIFNGAAETDGRFFIYSGAGTDNLRGGTGNDIFLFREAGGFTPADIVNGGEGTGATDTDFDQVALRGDYSANVNLGTSLVDIEGLLLVSGRDTRDAILGSNRATSFNYNITTSDAMVAAGKDFLVDAGSLVGASGSGATAIAAESLTFNGSAETNGTFRIFGGDGADTITGGQGNDRIRTGAGNDTLNIALGASGADQVDLGVGNDTVSVTGAAGSNIRLTFTSSEVGNGNGARATDGLGNVAFQLEDATGNLVATNPITRIDDEGTNFVSAAGSGITFDVRDTGGAARGELFEIVQLGTSGNDNIQAAQNRVYYQNGGGGNDLLFGNNQADFLVGGAGDDILTGRGGGDSLLGGAGADLFSYEQTFDSQRGNFAPPAGSPPGTVGPSASDTILDFTSGADRIDLGGIDARQNAGTSDDAFSFIGSAAFSGVSGELRSGIDVNGRTFVEADTNGDTFADLFIFVGAGTTGNPVLTAADFIL